jgi:hypothetical protein
MLIKKGLMLKTGNLADANLTVAPSSTKKKDGESDSEMH